MKKLRVLGPEGEVYYAFKDAKRLHPTLNRTQFSRFCRFYFTRSEKKAGKWFIHPKDLENLIKKQRAEHET